MHRTTRRVLAVLAVPVAAVSVLAVEGLLASRRSYLPNDPGYVVDTAVGTGSGAPLRLVVLGDSTTAGVGSPTEATSLPALVAERVAADLDRPVHVRSVGVSGARTLGVMTDQVPLAAGLDGVDVVLIVVGSNDTTRLTPPSTIEGQTRDLLTAAHAATGAPVVLGGVPRFTAASALDQPLRWVIDAWGAPLRAAQRRAVDDVPAASFLDIAGLASPRFEGVPEAMSSDGFHPTPVGYGFWADALAPAVAGAVRG